MEKKRSAEPAIIVALCVFLVLSGIEICVKLFFKEGLPVWGIYIYAVLQIVLMLVPSFILLKKQELPSRRFFQLRPFKAKWLPATLLGAVCATVGAAMINLMLYSLPFSHIFRSASVSVVEEGGAFAVFLAFVLIPALFEELFIHGALLSSIRNKGITFSVIICALIFAMLHSSAANFLGPLFAAVIYGYLTVVYQSVWPAVFAHLINNFVADYAAVLVDKYINIGMNGYVIFIAAALLLLSLYGFATCLLKQLKTVRVSVGEPEPVDKRFPVSLGVFILLWAVKITLDIINII